MEKNKSRAGVLKRSLIILPIAIVAIFVGELIYLHNFNSKVQSFSGEEAGDKYVTMELGKRDGESNTWLKRNYQLYGDTVDLEAQTYDGVIVNTTDYEIRDWQMRVNIHSKCFLNKAWCGTVEIHQDVNGKEKVQTVDLRTVAPEDMELDYLYDGDLLIPLYDGDYLIYYPSTSDGELPLAADKKLTIGIILYYLDEPDLSDFTVSYSFNRTFSQGGNVYLIILLIIIWLLALLMYVVSRVTYKQTVKEMEIKKSGILSMSDMYSIIYIIDLKKNELMPVSADPESEKLRPKNMSASDQLRNMFEYDCMDAYKEMALEFSDFATLEERFQGRNNIVFEYVSVNYGWCRIRFFAMDREEGAPLEKIVFTIQNINDEKAEMESISARVDEVEHESKAKSAFLANMSHEIRTPINTVIGLNTMILRESKEPAIRSYAKSISNASNMLLSIINGILDMSKIEADKMELVPEEYSLKELLLDVVGMVKTRAEFEKIAFVCDVAENLPDRLYGDRIRIKQVLINLITNGAKYTDEGTVKLSIFGKVHDGQVHLLVSVKDTGIGIREEDLSNLTQRFARFDEGRNHSLEGTGLGLNLVSSILGLMDSKLNVISEYGKGSEFYFEIEQGLVDETPIGKVDFDTEIVADDIYQVLFTAPNAKVLVVDDNAMNLNVFVELLKETKLQIETASSGFIALEKTRKEPYDIIFMDHMMPDMDGVETFHRIRAQASGPNAKTPVIVLTANALKGAKEEYKEIGFDDFLSKPIQSEVLERMILTHLDPKKVEKTQGIAEEKEEIEEMQMPVITGVDVAFGVTHTGGLKSYMGILKQFANVAATDLEELLSYKDAIAADTADREAIKSYRIKVHSMKASANIMGAFMVYGLAALLEKAAKFENVEEILQVTPYFADIWQELEASVKESLPEEVVDENAKEVDDETLESLLHLLETSIRAYDIKNADSVVEKLKGYKWDEAKTAVLSDMENAVANLDADATIELCKKLRDKTE